MHPWRGRHTTDGTCLGCQLLWSSKNNDKNQRHRRGCFRCVHCKQNPSRRTLGCTWYRKTPAEHCCPYHCRSARTWDSFCFAHVPRPYWLWYSFLLRRQRQEDSLGHLGVFFELTATLLILSSSPEVVDNACLAVIERFVVLLYDRTSNLTKVNEARHDQLFSKKSRTLEKIPPTQ